MPRPLVIAHRGASADAPENTLPAFQLAWQQGVDGIEGDFHLSRDRQIVCVHDRRLRRGFRRLSVRKARLSTLKSLDFGRWKHPRFAGTSIPTLDEVMATVPPGKLLYIEIKCGPSILPDLLRVLDASPLAPEQLVVISFSSCVIHGLKRSRPQQRAYLLSDLRQNLAGSFRPQPERLLRLLRRSGADGLGLRAHPGVDRDFVLPVLDAGYSLHVWTVDHPDEARRWALLGAQTITTNRPADLLKVL